MVEFATMVVIAGIVCILVPVFVVILADDAKTFLPRLAVKLLNRAADRLHPDWAESFREEWLAHMNDTPEITGKFWHGLRMYFFAGPAIGRLVGYAPDAWRAYFPIKRAFDLVLATLMLPAVAPVLAVAWLLVRLDGHAGFYSQVRVGKHGVLFRQYKLRTMYKDAEARLQQHLSDYHGHAEWFKSQKLTHDPRITPIGRILRATSLDELPQLFNVFNGSMSMVGPRAKMASQLSDANAERDVLLPPGITGTWQLSVEENQTSENIAEIDAEYYRSASFWLDLKIIWRTSVSVFVK